MAETLAVERQWLGAWFEGTPVRIEQRRGGVVTIDVPREFSFVQGETDVKPPLAAVLDKLAESLQRVPQAWLSALAAPGDGAAATASLAIRRAGSVRDYLRSRGVSASRLGKPSPAEAASVQLRMEALSAPADAL